MAIERIKLTVKEVSELKTVGTKGAQKLEFKVTGPDGKELVYFTFSTRLFPYIKEGAVLDVDVDTTKREHGGNTYTDRKVVQIYENGQPLGGGNRSNGWSKPDNTASIEAQTAAKIGCELLVAKVILPTDSLGKMVMKWCEDRLCGKQIKVEVVIHDTRPELSKTAVPAESSNQPQFKNAGEFYTRCWKEKHLAKNKVDEIIGEANARLAVPINLNNQADLSKAWEEVSKSK